MPFPESIQAALTTNTVAILHSHQHLASTTISGLQYKLGLVDGAIVAFDPKADQELFIEYNRRPGFAPPGDWGWEPCQGYYEKAK